MALQVSDGGTGAVDFSYTTASGATDSCSTVGRDYWFEYTASCTGTASVSTCQSDDVFLVGDIALSVSDACGGQELGCGESHPDSSCLDGPSAHASWFAIEGQTYFIRFSGTTDIEDQEVPIGIVIDGPDGIDVDDLLIVLNEWGSCPDGQSACAGDVNHDGTVNVDDLLVILNNWGPCVASE